MLEDKLKVFSFRALQECVTILNMLDRNSITIDELKNFVSKKKSDMTEGNMSFRDAIRDSKKTALINYNKLIEKCTVCKSPMTLRESTYGSFESEWYCKCGYGYHKELSMADYTQLFEATLQHKEVDFPPEEVRASLEERLRRREICEKCDQLQSANTCKACGCRMKHRTYYEILRCPKKRW